MFLGTAEAANLLNISTARVRILLSQGRIQGAYKIGRAWAIPLVNGLPVVRQGSRGPKPRWQSPRPRAKTYIHVNKSLIKQNKDLEPQDRAPVVSVKRGNSNLYTHEVKIMGPCRVVYQHDQPLHCGAKVWIETLSNVEFVGQKYADIVPSKKSQSKTNTKTSNSKCKPSSKPTRGFANNIDTII